MLARERARRERLAASVARRPHVAASQPAVLDLELRAEHMRDRELAGERLDLVARGRRHEGEGVATAAVRLHEPAGLGVDRGRDRAREDALGELLELLLGDVAQPRRRRRDESREADAAELEAEAVQ